MLNPFPIVQWHTVSIGARQLAWRRLHFRDVILRNARLTIPIASAPRVQRTRTSLQREISRNMSVEVAFNTSYGDHLSANIRQDYLPENWWNGSDVRDLTQQNLLNANVTIRSTSVTSNR